MAQRRIAVKLNEHERQLLIERYLAYEVPIDQFESRPDEFNQFVEEWNTLSKRHDSRGEVLHYMRTQRKRGLWVCFGGDHKSAPPPAALTADETEVLVNIHCEHVTIFEQGSDVLGYDDEIAGLIAKEFSAITGRIVPAHQLVAKLTALRKRGLLPKVEDHCEERQPDEDFGDIGQVG